jgi:hypothetical protein
MMTVFALIKAFEAKLEELEKLPAKPGVGFAKIKIKEKLAKLCEPVEGCEQCEVFETKCYECCLEEEVA